MLSLTNAGFESAGGGWLTATGAAFVATTNNYVWAPPEGTGFASLLASESVEQTTSHAASANKTYTLRAWARSTVPHLSAPGTPRRPRRAAWRR